MKKKEREIAALKKQIENEKTLSQLDEESRATAEKDMKIAELEGQLKDFQMAQTKNEVMKVLGARGLSAEFADMLAIGTDAEEAQQLIDSFDKLFKKEVAREVKARLAATSNVPQIADAMSGKMTKEQFNALSLAEQQAMYSADPELVRNLIG
jgi:autotransporter translocation and assembly factor TamB